MPVSSAASATVATAAATAFVVAAASVMVAAATAATAAGLGREFFGSCLAHLAYLAHKAHAVFCQRVVEVENHGVGVRRTTVPSMR